MMKRRFFGSAFFVCDVYEVVVRVRAEEVTPAIRLVENFISGPKYRLDRSNKKEFPSRQSNNVKKNQDTIVLGVMRTW
ncbi:MAG: hypothetical protein ABSA46_02745 [Thermodesulfovibrionales bacterium]